MFGFVETVLENLDSKFILELRKVLSEFWLLSLPHRATPPLPLSLRVAPL